MDNKNQTQLPISAHFTPVSRRTLPRKGLRIDYKTSRYLKSALLFVFTVLSVVLILSRFMKPGAEAVTQTAAPNQAADQVAIGKTYELPSYSVQNPAVKTGLVAMTIVSAKKVSQVSVNNQAIKAPEGQAFLLLDLELQNNNATDLGFFTRDYVRLIVDSKPYAPEFYNKDVVVAPIAVMPDKVSFLVNAAAESYLLRVGDLLSPSEEFTVSF